MHCRWIEQEDHVRVAGEAARVYMEAREAGEDDIGRLLMKIGGQLPKSKSIVHAKTDHFPFAPRYVMQALWSSWTWASALLDLGMLLTWLRMC
jgi:hypothetical protein